MSTSLFSLSEEFHRTPIYLSRSFAQANSTIPEIHIFVPRAAAPSTPTTRLTRSECHLRHLHPKLGSPLPKPRHSHTTAMHFLKPSLRLPKSYASLARHLSTHRTRFDHVGPMASLLKSRSVVRFRGPDTVKFLQGLLTNNVQRFCDSSGEMTSNLVTPNVPFMSASPMYALMLTPQGRFLYDLFLYRPARASEKLDSTGSAPGANPGGPLELLADVDATVLDELLERFNKYKLRADVVIENAANEFSCWQRYGEKLTEKFSSLEEPEAASIGWGGAVDPAGTSSSRGNDHGWQWFKDPRLDSLGFRGIFPSNTTPPLVEADKETNEENYLLWRLEKGVAEGSSEIPEGDAVPLEYNLAGLNALSFDKGCYVGQELIARTHHRGVIRKRLLPLKFLDESGKEIEQKVAPGSEVINALSRKKTGAVTTALGCRGLGLLRLEEALKSSSKLTIQGQEEVKVEAIRPEWWPTEWFQEYQQDSVVA